MALGGFDRLGPGFGGRGGLRGIGGRGNGRGRGRGRGGRRGIPGDLDLQALDLEFEDRKVLLLEKADQLANLVVVDLAAHAALLGSKRRDVLVVHALSFLPGVTLSASPAFVKKRLAGSFPLLGKFEDAVQCAGLGPGHLRTCTEGTCPP